MKKLSKFRKFVILTVGSVILFFVSVLLHNLFYALGIIFEDIFILKYLFEILSTIFFFVSVPIAPIAFIIGLIGMIVLLIKKK
ncbi:MAG: hypothetical protein ABIH25_00225 [Candidatus Woesearchaeota archaeon]